MPAICICLQGPCYSCVDTTVFERLRDKNRMNGLSVGFETVIHILSDDTGGGRGGLSLSDEGKYCEMKIQDDKIKYVLEVTQILLDIIVVVVFSPVSIKSEL